MTSHSASTRPLKLSAKERQLLALLPPSGAKVTSAALIQAYYHGQELPLNARVIITGRMQGIIKKLSYHRTEIRVHKSARRGPRPIEYWLSPAV